MIVGLIRLVFGFAGIWHEYSWRRHLRDSEISCGRIVGKAKGKQAFVARIAYTLDGREERFNSRYGWSPITIGQDIKVAHNRADGSVEALNFTTRWLWTLIPMGVSVAF